MFNIYNFIYIYSFYSACESMFLNHPPEVSKRHGATTLHAEIVPCRPNKSCYLQRQRRRCHNTSCNCATVLGCANYGFLADRVCFATMGNWWLAGGFRDTHDTPFSSIFRQTKFRAAAENGNAWKPSWARMVWTAGLKQFDLLFDVIWPSAKTTLTG